MLFIAYALSVLFYTLEIYLNSFNAIFIFDGNEFTTMGDISTILEILYP